MNAAIGWHADPAQPGIERLWDGRKWIAERPSFARPTDVEVAPTQSTVGFQLPSSEALAQLGAQAESGTSESRRCLFRRRASKALSR
jgi:hypothetical protein